MIKVLGLGNVCMSDDGFGPFVVRTIDACYQMPPDVHLIDAGTPGLDLTRYLAGLEAVILVDTVTADGGPGTVHAYELDDLLKAANDGLAHDPTLRRALQLLVDRGEAPAHVLLLGVVPEWTATGVTLSPAVRAAVEPVISVIVSELERLGAAPMPRVAARHADTWWEREVTV